eukprot:630402-Pelagomonas_calceolata.AAC.1
MATSPMPWFGSLVWLPKVMKMSSLRSRSWMNWVLSGVMCFVDSAPAMPAVGTSSRAADPPRTMTS